MAIPTLSIGQKLKRSLVNLIINTLNAHDQALLTIAASNKSFVAVSFDGGGTPTIIQKAGNVASVSNPASNLRVTFTTPIEDKKYSAVCTCTAVQGNDTGFAQLSVKEEEYVEFIFRTDDGSGNFPYFADVILTF